MTTDTQTVFTLSTTETGFVGVFTTMEAAIETANRAYRAEMDDDTASLEVVTSEPEIAVLLEPDTDLEWVVEATKLHTEAFSLHSTEG